MKISLGIITTKLSSSIINQKKILFFQGKPISTKHSNNVQKKN